MLKLEGWDSYAVHAGEETHEQLKSDRPDLVILDIRMDSRNTGWSLLNALKLDPATRDTPVIVTSGIPRELDEHEPWLRKHRIGILPKPFDLEDLHTCVRTALKPETPGHAIRP